MRYLTLFLFGLLMSGLVFGATYTGFKMTLPNEMSYTDGTKQIIPIGGISKAVIACGRDPNVAEVAWETIDPGNLIPGQPIEVDFSAFPLADGVPYYCTAYAISSAEFGSEKGGIASAGPFTLRGGVVENPVLDAPSLELR